MFTLPATGETQRLMTLCRGSSPGAPPFAVRCTPPASTSGSTEEGFQASKRPTNPTGNKDEKYSNGTKLLNASYRGV